MNWKVVLYLSIFFFYFVILRLFIGRLDFGEIIRMSEGLIMIKKKKIKLNLILLNFIKVWEKKL